MIAPRLRSLVRKELRQLFRDRRTLRIVLAAPLLQLLLFGYAISTDLQGVRLGVVTEAPGSEARSLIRSIQATGTFVLQCESTNPNDAADWLETGAAQAVLILPRDFSRSLERREAPEVQVLSDGSDPNTATLAYQSLSVAALSWAADERARRGLAAAPGVTLATRYWYNPGLRSVAFQVPGILAILILTLGMSMASLAVVRERELGTLEQLSVTPLSAAELLLGKAVPVAGVGLLVTLAVTAAAVGWFGLPLRGSAPFLLLAAVLFLVNVTGLGLLVSVASRTQLQAQLTASFVTTPMVLLSGFLFPIANMPPWAQALTHMLPARYYMEITRGVFLKAQGLAELWPQAVALALLGVFFYAAAILALRWGSD